MKRRTLFFLLILFSILMIPGAVFAQTSSTTVEAGETVSGDITILEGDLFVEDGAVVTGDISILSGNAVIAGQVDGDIVLMSGTLEFTDTAVVNSDSCVVLGGRFINSGSVNLQCDHLSGDLPNIPALVAPFANAVVGDYEGIRVSSETTGDVSYQSDEEYSEYDEWGAWEESDYQNYEHNRRPGFFLKMLGVFVRTFFAGLLGFAVATLFPNHLEQVKSTVQEKLLVSGAVGGLTSLAAVVLNILLSPIIAVLVLVCGIGLILGLGLIVPQLAAMALGWVTMGALVGDKLGRWFNLNTRSAPLLTAVGTAALTFTLGFFGAIPFVVGEGLISVIIAWIGLGAVALTKFGTRPYPPYLSDEIRIITPDADKVNAVLDTLPDDDPFKTSF